MVIVMLSLDATGWWLAIALLPTFLLLPQRWQARTRVRQRVVSPVRVQASQQPRR